MTRSSWDPTPRSYGTGVWTLGREQPLERRLLGGVARIDVLVEQCRHDLTETVPGHGAGDVESSLRPGGYARVERGDALGRTRVLTRASCRHEHGGLRRRDSRGVGRRARS